MFNSKQPTFLFAVGAAVTTSCVGAASAAISWTGMGDAGASLEAGTTAVTIPPGACTSVVPTGAVTSAPFVITSDTRLP